MLGSPPRFLLLQAVAPDAPRHLEAGSALASDALSETLSVAIEESLFITTLPE